MEASHINVKTWLLAIYLIGSCKKSISSVLLANILGLTQPTAWSLAHKIRESGTETVKLLGDVVEADETFVGGKEANKHFDKKTRFGRGATGKTPVFGLIQRGGRAIIQMVEDTKESTLSKIIKDVVARGTNIMTDESLSYKNLSKHGFDHQTVNHSQKQYVNGDVHTNSVESLWSKLKSTLWGIHHHTSSRHLPNYLNEMASKHNNPNFFVQTVDNILFPSKIVYERTTKKTRGNPPKKKQSFSLREKVAV